MGFHLDYDQYDVKGKGWIRFTLTEDLYEKDLRWIWYKDDAICQNLSRGAKILFKAGQKAFKKRLNEYVEL
jgi:hypothetical protein